MLLPGLRGVREEDDAAGGGDRRALDGGLGEVRGGQAALGGESVRREEQDVGADLGVRAERPRVDGGAGAVADAAADEMEVDPGVVGEPGGDGQRVGDHGEGRFDRDGGREAGDGAARVEDDAAAVGEFAEGGGRDAVLLVRGGGLPLGEVRLEVEAAGRDGAAVHAADQAGPVEGLEVAAYGLGGDLEPLGEGDHVDPAGLAGEAEDLLLALRCVHVGLHPFDARFCGFPYRTPDCRRKQGNGHARLRRRACPWTESGKP